MKKVFCILLPFLLSVGSIALAAPSTNNNTIKTVNAPQNTITTPILIKGFLAGGLFKGKWMGYDAFYNSNAVNLNGFKYDVYVNHKKTGTAVGSKLINSKTGEVLEGKKYIEEFDGVALYNAKKQEVAYDIALKANWNLFPRTYKKQSTSQKNYDSLVKNLLIKAGLKNPKTAVKQVIRVDLEGDGVEEVLLSADNTVNDQFQEVKKGDNAILVFRKLVNGKVVDQVVEEDVLAKEPQYVSLYRHLFRVEDIADLDGDGIMEVIVKAWYYEGDEWDVYKLINHRLVPVAGNGWGA